MKMIKFFKEVKAEAKKISWASFAQTRMLTVIVALISLFIALYLLAVDKLLQEIIDFIVKF